MIESNIFGQGEISDINDLTGKHFITCTACMSVLADALSWCNYDENRQKITKNVDEADNIILLSCQVTDLSVLNDLMTIQRYKRDYPNKKYYISGCLAKRFDIELGNVKRLEQFYADQWIHDKTLVKYENPFWVKDFKHDKIDTIDGYLFRDCYPLRISRGCKGKCEYCTIKTTRGEYIERNINIREFMGEDNVLLIADSPSVEQLKWWINTSIKYNKQISIRNVEPHTTVKLEDDLFLLASKNLLKVFHSPIQSFRKDIIEDMNRNCDFTEQTIDIFKALKKLSVITATNVIVDYKLNKFKKEFSNFIYSEINHPYFTRISWNPYWNGEWNIENAIKRWKYYLPNNNFC